MKVQLNDIRDKKTHGGKEPINHSPALDYCRKLIKEGYDPVERLDVYRGEMLAYSVVSLEEGAKWKVLENNEDGPCFKKHTPLDEKAQARFDLIRGKKQSGRGVTCS